MKHISILFFLGLTVVLTTLHAEAALMTFKIEQDGWKWSPVIPTILSGGKIIGSFSGEDLDNNGIIDLANNEVTSYLVKFTGSIFTPDFTHTFNDLLYFRYTIGSAGFGPNLSFPLYSVGDGFEYDADDRVIKKGPAHGPPGSYFVETTDQPAFVTSIPVTSIPEPPTLALIIYGLALCGWAAKRRCI